MKYIIFSALISLLLSACTTEPTQLSPEPAEIPEDTVELIEELDYSNLTRAEADELDKRIAKSNKEIYSTAVQNGDSDLCETIESEDLRRSCTQTALIQEAVEANDKSLCKKLDSEKGRANCENKVDQTT